jgi:signal transduction histidine kinase
VEPETDEQLRDRWYTVISSDPSVEQFLRDTLPITTPSIVEINIATADGGVLASSAPDRVGKPIQRKQKLADWSQLSWYQRIYDLLSLRPDWEVSPRPLGVSGQPVLQVQVVASSVIERLQIIPLLQQLALISGAAVVIALVLTWVAAASALRPLRRIEQTIDRITQGTFRKGEEQYSMAKEFQALESKLNILGQRMVQSAMPPQEPGTQKLDVLMERVATQFEVAQRLSAISQLSSGVAHEIKNPLNAILLRLDLLKVRLGEEDEEVAQELAILSKEVLRLNRVVTTFLDFSRPVEVHWEDLDLVALAREVAELVRPQANASKIDLLFKTSEDSAAMRGDPDLLKQALLNLVTNAVEAMSAQGGKLVVQVSRSGANWVLEVVDTGPGIPPELRSKVFQLYFTSKSKGSGIGLAMTYRAAQLHNGTVSFTSESGVGTTFRMEFPATAKHA